MKGSCYIDNTDIFPYGVLITEGGYNDLLTFPALVEPEKTIWPDENGIEVDLSNPVLKSREITISFSGNDTAGTSEFLSFLARPGYRSLRIPVLGREWNLRLSKTSSNEVFRGACIFSLTFVEDKIVRPEEITLSGPGMAVPSSPVQIDGVDLSAFGIIISEAENDLFKTPSIRQNLTRSFSTSDGQLYDAGAVYFTEKEVTLKGAFFASDIARFWSCYEAFFFSLVKPGERSIYVDKMGSSFPCYYKKSSGFEVVSVQGKVVVEFSITLVFTSCQAGATEYLLATEAGEFITTEDDYFIDLSRNVPAATGLQSVLPVSETTSESVEIRKRKISQMPAAGSLENLILPAVDRTTNQNVHIPSDLLKTGTGEKGEKGDSAQLVILGSFPTLEDLQAAWPAGPAENGVFKIDDLLYIWTGDKYEPVSFDVFRAFSLEQFREVIPSGGNIIIDYSKAPYARVALSGDSNIFNLSINNTEDGSAGKILVFQTGFKQLSVAENIRGTVDLPLSADTIALLSYNKLGDIIYIHSNTILGDIQFPTPQKVNDFQVVYSDSTACTVQWASPHANNIYDKVTEYDIRYSNSLVDADDEKVWSGMKKVEGTPDPLQPGEIQTMTITGLTPNREYYVYLKSVKINYGVKYTSEASDFIYFKTLGSEDTSKAYRLNLTEKNLTPSLTNYNLDTYGNPCTIGNIVDETESNVFLSDGYPDLTNKGYVTFWHTYQYSRNTVHFYITIDLFSQYSLDKLFVYSKGKPRFSIYTMKDIGWSWEKVGEISIPYNAWASIDFNGMQGRFISLAFDLVDIGAKSKSPAMSEPGDEGFPEPEYNDTLDQISNLLVYGRPLGLKPEGIMPPVRRATTRKTVDQFFCTNGHLYQQGRIHSMCSGEKVRLYAPLGLFDAELGTSNQYTRLADMKFVVNKSNWVSGNNGLGVYIIDMLRQTYLPYGLKPFLTGTDMFEYCYYDKSTYKFNRMVDDYWLPGVWRPVPQRGVGGLDRYYSVTQNPEHYKTMSKLCYALAAKYGNNPAVSGEGLFYDETADTGLDLISGIEPANEPDMDWNGFAGYTSPREYAALVSATFDGHCNTLEDEENKTTYGQKRASDVLSICPGTAGIGVGYIQAAYLWWKSNRKDASIPTDVFSWHMYCSNVGNQESSSASIQYGVPLEEALQTLSGQGLIKGVEFRNRFCSDKEIWITEFGWGESGARNTQSRFQCYSQPGRYIGDWLIPDRHRSDVKGAWIVRACIQLMAMGVDMVNYYSTECESNYFDSTQWGAGAGFEMFHWNDCIDHTPGAKVEAIKPYEVAHARGSFATTGLFGQLLGNGGYPITRAYWWIATFRNRLKGYVYAGMKYIEADSRIVVACFKKQGENKGAYVVYANDNQNTGIPDVEIPVPDGITSYKHVTIHVPNIPNPESVPDTLGWDKERTGLPTARKEKYINGKWVLQNQPYYQGRHMSYTKAPAVYPQNPKEGDEITVLPTTKENPYFPIVGPVQAKHSTHGNLLSAQQYEQDRENWENEPQVDSGGNTIWTVKADAKYSWRQVDAICDYIDYHPEGIRGAHGDEVTKEAVRGMIQTNVTEFPEFFLFDAAPTPDYKSSVTDLSSSVISGSAIELFWNNTNPEDDGYQIFSSSLPETGYTLLKEVAAGIENKAIISGLAPDITYYYKIRPMKNGIPGTLSDYTSAKTFADIPAPTGLIVSGRTATSISLTWEYAASVSSFVAFVIYRSEESGSYVEVGRVDDISNLSYTDTGLAVGRNYYYKVRVVGLNGFSDYTQEVETRTLLAEETPPQLVTAMTDKLGIKILLTFDLPIAEFAENVVSDFSLTEEGSDRLIISALRDVSNENIVVLTITESSLKHYDSKTDVRLSYVSKNVIKSVYGVAVESFSIKVINMIGNFTNLEATYNINLCPLNSDVPDDTTWNNLQGNPLEGIISVGPLIDSYARMSALKVSSVTGKNGNTIYQWGGSVSNGVCEVADIPDLVYKTGWANNYFSDDTQGSIGRLKFENLDPEYKYTVRAFGATDAQYGADTHASIRVNGIKSNVLTYKGNKNNFMILENCQPGIDGTLYMDFITEEAPGTNRPPFISFIILEEYKSNDLPENHDIYLRSVGVVEDDGAGVTVSEIHVHLNFVGSISAYRIGEVEDLTSIAWIDIVESVLDVPYTMTGFGQKTLFVQVKNLYNESNIRSVDVLYKDSEIPLELTSIVINEGATSTDSQDVQVFINKLGTATHYRIGENADLSSLSWQEWPAGTSIVPFTLSAGSGEKTIYCQLKNDTTETAVRSSAINFKDAVTPEKRKLIVALGWRSAAPYFDEVLKINTPMLYPQSEARPLRWTNSENAGTFTNINCTVYSTQDSTHGAVTGDDSGPYPDEYLRNNTVALKWNGVVAIDFKFVIQAGRYRMRLFASTIYANSKPMPQGHYYVITEGYGTENEVKTEIVQPTGFTYVNNLTSWLEIELTVDGEFYLRAETIANGDTVVVPVNVIEIETI